VVCRQAHEVRHIDPESASELTAALRKTEELLRSQGFTEVGHIVEFFATAPAPAQGAG